MLWTPTCSRLIEGQHPSRFVDAQCWQLWSAIQNPGMLLQDGTAQLVYDATMAL